MQMQAGVETERGRSTVNWQVRRGLTAVVLAVVLVAVLAFAVTVGAEPAHACLLPSIPC